MGTWPLRRSRMVGIDPPRYAGRPSPSAASRHATTRPAMLTACLCSVHQQQQRRYRPARLAAAVTASGYGGEDLLAFCAGRGMFAGSPGAGSGFLPLRLSPARCDRQPRVLGGADRRSCGLARPPGGTRWPRSARNRGIEGHHCGLAKPRGRDRRAATASGRNGSPSWTAWPPRPWPRLRRSAPRAVVSGPGPGRTTGTCCSRAPAIWAASSASSAAPPPPPVPDRDHDQDHAQGDPDRQRCQ